MYGDIHGCFEEFIELRSLIHPRPEDQEICVGDLINKGPHSLEVVCFIQKEKIQAVRGNHEDKFIRYYLHEKEKEQTGKKNPMRLELSELRLYYALTPQDFEFLFSLPLFIQLASFTILHAGVLPSTNLKHLDKKEAAKVMRVRYVDHKGRFVTLDRSDPKIHFWWSELYDGRYGTIIYGHQPFLRPRVDRFAIGIDTGAVYGNALSALVIEGMEREFVQVPSQAYAKRSRPWPLL